MKPKWDERTYFMVQDKLFEAMDDGMIDLNEGWTDLMVFAIIRVTCSRGGAIGKDQFDVSGLIAKWARIGGENAEKSEEHRRSDSWTASAASSHPLLPQHERLSPSHWRFYHPW